MKCLIFKRALLGAGVLLLGVGCRKQDAFLTSRGTGTTVRAVHPLDDPTSLFVSVYYDDSGPGYVDVSWTGEPGGTYKVSVGSQAIIATGNSASIQKHYSSPSTITASVSTLDGSKTGTGSYYFDKSNSGANGNVYNPLPPFSNMEIISDLGGCTMNFTWTPPTPFSGTAYFYLELHSPEPPGSDGEWINYITANCSTWDGHKSIHINRYYYNDAIINARLVIQNTPYSVLPPLYPYFSDGRLNLWFHLPSTSYHFSGTQNQFYQNF
ncbi:MAG TPA: hypothetical protein VHC48_24975 [Puia sp.]|jgi:hypothetical protein|nr:hypothetical protein [Puia sp.]